MYADVGISDVLVLVDLVLAAVLHLRLDALVLDVVHVTGAGTIRSGLCPPGMTGQRTFPSGVVVLGAGTRELGLNQTQLHAVEPRGHARGHSVIVTLEKISHRPLEDPRLLTRGGPQADFLKVRRPKTFS